MSKHADTSGDARSGSRSLPEREGQALERKSLSKVEGPKADFSGLARTCVCMANAAGGHILIGIEDGEDDPPPARRIRPGLLDEIRKRVASLTVNVQNSLELYVADNGGEVLRLTVMRSSGVASTTDGRFYLRIGDECHPLVGDEVMRLMQDRPTSPWEKLRSLEVPRAAADATKVAALVRDLRASERVNPMVKEKTDDELLEHYDLVSARRLTNLGVLLVGTAADRRRLGTAPVVQAITYDGRGEKVGKIVWDDCELTPLELIDAIWNAVPAFRESYELPAGMFRTAVPALDQDVVRELLVNALVHRPYTQAGDIFLNVHPDRLEVVNPGRLPLGVTPRNILHVTRRRNDGLARVFYDLKRMEREGTGFNLMYERLLSSGRAAPVAEEGIDSVKVVIVRRRPSVEVVRFMADASQRYQLNQRELIALGLLAQSEGYRARELADKLELEDLTQLSPWIDRLVRAGLVEQVGRTKGTRYFVPPGLLRSAGLDGVTTLARVEPYRVKALVLEDLKRYPDSSFSEVRRRVGMDIPERRIRGALAELVSEGSVSTTGQRRWRRYHT